MKKIILFALVFCFGLVSCNDDDVVEINNNVNDCYIIDGHRFVDLGLPSGLLWAEENVGASKEYGVINDRYFGWGEASFRGLSFNYECYTFWSNKGYSKYNHIDNKTILDKEDDTAYNQWGTSCRMPRSIEFQELIENCTWEWTSYPLYYDRTTNGWLVTSKKNGNKIFLPTTGYISDNRTSTDMKTFCYYWASDAKDYGNGRVICPYYLGGGLTMDGLRYFVNDNECRYYGYAIRPVAER